MSKLISKWCSAHAPITDIRHQTTVQYCWLIFFSPLLFALRGLVIWTLTNHRGRLVLINQNNFWMIAQAEWSSSHGVANRQIPKSTIDQHLLKMLHTEWIYKRTRLFRSHWDLSILTVILKVCYNEVKCYWNFDCYIEWPLYPMTL